MEVCGVDAEEFCGFGVVAVCLFESAEDELLLHFKHGFVKAQRVF